MATKTFCDACGAESTEYGHNKYEYRCHLDDLAEGKYMNGFVDRHDNAVSRKPVIVDLCNACYNKVVMPSVKKLKEIQKENECPTSAQ